MAGFQIIINGEVFKTIPHGFCACGCGLETGIPTKTNKKMGRIKGRPMRSLPGHGFKGANHPGWKGGKIVDFDGYVLIHSPGHPKANSGGYVREHILIIEKALGKFMPAKSQGHHHNGKKSDNRHENLIACEDNGYHLLLHQRARAYYVCGHADWRKCSICKQYDPPEKLYINRNTSYHNDCINKRQRDRRKNKLSNYTPLL